LVVYFRASVLHLSTSFAGPPALTDSDQPTLLALYSFPLRRGYGTLNLWRVLVETETGRRDGWGLGVSQGVKSMVRVRGERVGASLGASVTLALWNSSRTRTLALGSLCKWNEGVKKLLPRLFDLSPINLLF
jgi:hypothetical protein